MWEKTIADNLLVWVSLMTAGLSIIAIWEAWTVLDMVWSEYTVHQKMKILLYFAFFNPSHVPSHIALSLDSNLIELERCFASSSDIFTLTCAHDSFSAINQWMVFKFLIISMGSRRCTWVSHLFANLKYTALIAIYRIKISLIYVPHYSWHFPP